MWIGKGHQANTWYHIYPFIFCKNINNFHVLRFKKTPKDVDLAEWHLYKHNNYYFGIIKLIFLGIKISFSKKIDTIISFSLFPWAIIAWFVAKISRKKIVVGFVGTDFNYHLRKSPLRKIYFYILSKSDAISVTGSNMKDWILKNIQVNEKKVIVLPHLIDKTYKGFKIPKYDLIHVSKLTENKNVECILRAVSLLKKSNININCCIIGDGDQMQNLIDYVSENDIKENIFFEGYKKNVLDYYRNSKIFIQSSKNEGLSLALVEAISCGLVPIITNAGSEKDYITNNINGLYYDFDNHHQLAKKIIYTLKTENYSILKNNIIHLQRSLIAKNNHLPYENLIYSSIS